MKISFKSVLTFLGAAAAFAAFAMMFFAPLESILKVGETIKVTGTISWQQAYLGTIEGSEETLPHTIIPMIGYILMGVGGLAGLALTALANKKGVYFIHLIFGIIVAALIAAGAIIVYFTETFYLKELGIKPDDMLDLVQLTIYPLVGAGCGVGGAALIILSSLLPTKK